MNWLDIVIIVYLVLSVLGGLMQGLIRTVLGLAGLILGIYLAGRYYVTLGSWLPIANESIANVVAFAIILVGIIILAGIIAFFVRRVLRLVMLGWVDKLLGAVFGLILGGLMCGAVLALLTHFFSIEGTVSGSWLATFLLDRFPVVLALLPDEFDSVRQYFQ